MKNLCRIFRVLGNPRRLAIVRLLMERKELSVGTVASAMRLSLTATSRHLGALANLDLLDKRQEDKVVYYRMADDLSAAHRTILKLLF